ncbi:hypothetical protein CVIRNUC_004930 [Coccomyxa viridis]|uniref:Major facilitator superfamily (MFS) profile domain-containing protein n=1 Tax=Coccomyxa viridis TaxID=1274662 RepID=A0AAV1I6A1_9CHLO|nr:hypothetical protein CVIRNUC_004930 [Coccomyxa viridis]
MSMMSSAEASARPDSQVDGQKIVRKCYWNVAPWLWLMSFFTYLDRSNLSFAAFQFKADMNLSNSTYGLGASLFFVGYCIGQTPSNIIMRYVGSKWLSILIIAWGIVSALGCLLKSGEGYLAQRVVLGLVEAGTFPGVVVHVTKFFTAAEVQRALSFTLTALSISQVLGAPIGAGLIMMDGLRGIRGWRWLFLIEGLITIIFGIIFYFGLASKPAKASFLTPPERDWLVERQATELAARRKEDAFAGSMWGTFLNWRIYYIGVGWLLEETVRYGILYWTPLILDGILTGNFNGKVVTGIHGTLREAAWYSAKLSLISAILFTLATIAIVAGAYSSSYFQERNIHMACFLTISGIAFICVPTALRRSGGIAGFAVLCIAGASTFAGIAPCTSWVPALVHGPAVNTGFGIFNTMGTMGGIIGPYLIGVLSDRYSYAVAMSTLGAFNLAAALVFLTSPSGREKESTAREHRMQPSAQSADAQLVKPGGEP